MFTVKALVESGCLTSVPPKYVFAKRFDDYISSEAEMNIPTIDFSLLTSGTPDQRSKAIQDLGNACREWGFFMVINHGVPKTLRDEMFRGCQSFFNLTEEEKVEFAGKQLFDPIRCGTSFNVIVDQAFLWRDYLKVWVHPIFSAPHKPAGFSEIIREYCKRSGEVASELMRGISKSIGLEETYMQKTLDLDEGSQLLVVNLYPPCPEPELAIGLPPHTDHGLLTLLMENELHGLEVMHKGKWVTVNPPPNSFLVNAADHMEILTNGKYKSVVHRAVVNNKATRISIGTAYGPPLDTIVSPAYELVDWESHRPAAFRGIKYMEYLELQQSKPLDGKSCLDRVRL